jgi:dihydrofolate reductase
MTISIIAAMGANRVIGYRNALPWHLPADLKHFKSITMGKPMIMGRKTWLSIGRPLPGRRSIVVTRDPMFRAEGCEIAHALEAALKIAGPASEVVVIGGAQLFSESLPLADRLYLTVIDHMFQGDVYFPPVDATRWKEVSREEHESDSANLYRYRFLKYER